MLKEILTRREAAEYLSVGASTLERWGREGHGPKMIRLSARRIGYRKADLDAWLNERAGAGAGEAA